MSRSKVVLPLVARRELAAVKQAAGERYERHASAYDRTFARTIIKLRPARVTAARPKVIKGPKVHTTSVSPVDGKFLATCSCGDQIMARPTGESYAKGMATKHLNAVSVRVDAAA